MSRTFCSPETIFSLGMLVQCGELGADQLKDIRLWNSTIRFEKRTLIYVIKLITYKFLISPIMSRTDIHYSVLIIGILYSRKNNESNGFQLGTHDKINTDINMCYDIHYELVRE